MPKISSQNLLVLNHYPDVTLIVTYDVEFSAEDSPNDGIAPFEYYEIIFIAGMDLHPEALTITGDGPHLGVFDEHNKMIGHILQGFVPMEKFGPDERNGYPQTIRRDIPYTLRRESLIEDGGRNGDEIACSIQLVGKGKKSLPALTNTIKMDPYIVGKPFHIPTPTDWATK
jgi:hypothetical protein